jgi:RNA polymerase sigma factor (sigma-70 family)
MTPRLDTLVESAKASDKAALEEIIRGIQDRVYGLALRMLWHPEDAKDATQEILIRIVTHLGSFRHESAFMTWVYRVAANYLVTTRKRRAELEGMTFERFGRELDEGLSDGPLRLAAEADQDLLVEEVKIGCTQGMLLCLDRDHRLAYILGEIFEVTGEEGGTILGISAATFRKRLSRARNRVREFMRQKCGLVNPANRCRCARRVERAIRIGRIDPHHLLFAGQPARARRDADLLRRIEEMEELERAAAVFRSHPDYAAPETFLETIRTLIDSGRFRVLEE